VNCEEFRIDFSPRIEEVRAELIKEILISPLFADKMVHFFTSISLFKERKSFLETAICLDYSKSSQTGKIDVK